MTDEHCDKLFRRIIETTSEGIWTIDADAKTTFVNGRLAEMLGYPVDELIGRPLSAFVHDQRRLQADAALDRRRQGVAERHDAIVVRKDGTHLWVSLQVNPFFDDKGTYEGALAVVTDITDRKKAEEIRARLAAIVELSDDAIISADGHGVITTWNQGAERLFGFTAEEAVGRAFHTLYPRERRDELRDMVEQVRGGARVRNCDAVLLSKRGALIDAALAIYPIRDALGQVDVCFIARDMTDQRRAERALRTTEEQLRQAQKMEAIGNLAGGIAHDFNNILSVILSYAKLMLEDLPAGDPVRADMEEVALAGARGGELTRQLLAFSRQQVLQPKVLDLNQTILGLEKMLRRLLGEDIVLTLSPQAHGKVNADPSQIEQVLMNLVVNARDAMPRGGKLTIETSDVTLDSAYASDHASVASGKYTLITVADTGVGMDAATRARVFEPFFTTKEKGKGTGLGLATVYGIVQQSHGHITVHSEPEKGTTFEIYLPHAAILAGESRPSMVPPLKTLRGVETVLLVEDEDQVRAIARTILKRSGYDVLEAQNGGEAFLVCEQYANEIHVLVTDVVMPRMSGRQLAERLAPLRPDMKVLYMSGYTEDSVVRHGVDSGIAFLQKPITPDSLLRKVREVLDTPS